MHSSFVKYALRAQKMAVVLLVPIALVSLISGFALVFSGPSAAHVHAQGDELPSCGSVSEMRLHQTPVPVTPEPATATPADAPTPTPRPPTPTPRPAPTEDRVGFPADYQENFKLLFVFDRPDNNQVRVICGNDIAAATAPGEPFAHGSVLVMETWRVLLDENEEPVLDDDGHYIRVTLTNVFVMRKEEDFGEAYLEDRSGEWEYVAYRPTGETSIPPQNTNNCASCHLRQAGEDLDFVFRMAMLYEPEMAMTPVETAENEVQLFIYAFMPETLTVPVGTTVTWMNNDEAEHTVVSVDDLFESEVLRTVNVAPGETFSFTFDEPGTYEYFCSIHRGMTGTIVVSG